MALVLAGLDLTGCISHWRIGIHLTERGGTIRLKTLELWRLTAKREGATVSDADVPDTVPGDLIKYVPGINFAALVILMFLWIVLALA